MRITGSDCTGRIPHGSRPGRGSLVAFVQDAPLREVLADIASLYRLDWSRGQGARPAYRLYRRPSVEREEKALRERAVRDVLTQLAARFRRPSDDEHHDKAWSFLFPQLLPVFEARVPELTREGFAYIPVPGLPPDRRTQVMAAMQRSLSKSRCSTIYRQPWDCERRTAAGAEYWGRVPAHKMRRPWRSMRTASRPRPLKRAMHRKDPL